MANFTTLDELNSPSTSPGLPRLLPRFTLRGLLVFVTFCCVLIGWLAVSAKRQYRTRIALSELGASVYFEGDPYLPGQASSIRARLFRPLAGFVGFDLLLPVTVVKTRYLEEPTLRAGAEYSPREIIELLPQLPSLDTARLTHTEITNEDLHDLHGMDSLKHLDLSMTRLHEGPLDGLRGLGLERLALSRTRVDDRGLKSLRGMTSLRHLRLTRTKVTDTGLRHLVSLPNLETVIIRRALVSEAGYMWLRERRPDLEIKWEALKRR